MWKSIGSRFIYPLNDQKSTKKEVGKNEELTFKMREPTKVLALTLYNTMLWVRLYYGRSKVQATYAILVEVDYGLHPSSQMVVLDRVELSSDDYKSPALTTELKHNI